MPLACVRTIAAGPLDQDQVQCKTVRLLQVGAKVTSLFASCRSLLMPKVKLKDTLACFKLINYQ